MNTNDTRVYVEERWNNSVLRVLQDYIRIPNLSSAYDPQWFAHGHMDRAVRLFRRWAMEQPMPGLTVEVVQLPERTPLIFMEIPGTRPGTIMLYGHLDKQPPFDGWREGLGPWTPVIEGDRLYGRGAADDGYAIFSALTALRVLDVDDTPHARCVVLIEADKESGSNDLPAYIEHLAGRIGSPDLVICLDSGCGNYDQLWQTTSLRGLVDGVLRVEVLKEGVHSGDASGIVPSSFRIARQLLSRIENADTGHVAVAACHGRCSEARLAQAEVTASALGDSVHTRFPWAEGSVPLKSNPRGLVLARTWDPALSVTGAGGLPPVGDAGSVLRPFTALKLSMRIAPTADPQYASEQIKIALETAQPRGAKVTFTVGHALPGWDAPPQAPWLEQAIDQASWAYFGQPAMAMGEGGTIPFMRMLGDRFPAAQFLITGVLGPESNAHGPNEFLHLPTAVRLTCCIADVIADHATRPATK